MDSKVLVKCALLLCVIGKTSTTGIGTCPASSGTTFHKTFGSSNYVQRDLWHAVPCPVYQSNEPVLRYEWSRVQNTSSDFTTILEYLHSSESYLNESKPYLDGSSWSALPCRYKFESIYALGIRGVKATDEGRYNCHVLPLESNERSADVDIKVIGDTFPASNGTPRFATLKRGRREKLQCPCVPPKTDATTSVVYWSVGEGVTSDTDIIGARFSDGTFIQFPNGADYSIDKNFSLRINSLAGVSDTQRFWCHAFFQNRMLSGCYYDVEITDEARVPYGYALKASDTLFYLQNETSQVLPCTSWVSGETTCSINWLKGQSSGRHLISYHVQDDYTEADDGFDLVHDFGLLIKYVDNEDADTYSCTQGVGSTSYNITARVIGKTFLLPPDDDNVIEGASKTFKPNMELPCSSLANVTATGRATLFWSYGKNNSQTTTVIGRINFQGDSGEISHLGENGCFNISQEGFLVIANCSQGDDVRYWCHVFSSGDVVRRSFIDVKPDKAPKHRPPTTYSLETHIIIIIVVVGVAVLFLFIGVLVWYFKRERRNSTTAGNTLRMADIHRPTSTSVDISEEETGLTEEGTAAAATSRDSGNSVTDIRTD